MCTFKWVKREIQTPSAMQEREILLDTKTTHTEGGNLISSSFHKFFFFKKKKKGVDFLLFLLFFFFGTRKEKKRTNSGDWVVVVGVSSVDLRPADGIVITPTNRRLASSFSSLLFLSATTTLRRFLPCLVRQLLPPNRKKQSSQCVSISKRNKNGAGTFDSQPKTTTTTTRIQ